MTFPPVACSCFAERCLLASGEAHKSLEVAAVCLEEGRDVSGAEGCGIDQFVASSPGKAGSAELFDQDVGHQSGMASVAVGKGMDRQEALMEAHSIGESRRELHPDLPPVRADALVVVVAGCPPSP